MSYSGFQIIHFALDFCTLALIGCLLWQRHLGLLAIVFAINSLPDLFPTAPNAAHVSVIFQLCDMAMVFLGNGAQVNISRMRDEFDWLQRVRLISSLTFGVSALLILHARRAMGIALLILFIIPSFYYLHRMFQVTDWINSSNFETQFLFFLNNGHAFFSSIQSNPTGQIMLLLISTAIGIAVVLAVYITRKEFRLSVQWLPSPQLYWVVMDGKARPFQINEKEIKVDGLTFDLNKSYRLASQPYHLYFSTGSVVQFIEKHDADETPSKATLISLKMKPGSK